MTNIIILIAVLLLLNIVVIVAYINLVKRLPQSCIDEAKYYDENGNHIYYDRKLIARLEKESSKNTNNRVSDPH